MLTRSLGEARSVDVCKHSELSTTWGSCDYARSSGVQQMAVSKAQASCNMDLGYQRFVERYDKQSARESSVNYYVAISVVNRENHCLAADASWPGTPKVVGVLTCRMTILCRPSNSDNSARDIIEAEGKQAIRQALRKEMEDWW